MRKLIVCGVGLVAALALTVPGAFGGAAQTPGVTAKSITIGGTFPLTGVAAAYAPIPLGMKAYFSYINARRGAGRQAWRDGAPDHLEVLRRRLQPRQHASCSLDGSSSRTRSSRLSASSGRSRISQSAGYMNQQKVPQALVSTGASYWGLQYKEFPWTTGWQPDYIAEGRLYGSPHQGELQRQEDRDPLPERRLRQGLPVRAPRGTRQAYADANVVAQEAVEATATSVAQQMVRIRASGATIFVIFQLPTPTVRTIATGKALGYQPGADLHELRLGIPAADGRCDRRCGSPVRQRHPVGRLPQGCSAGEVGQRPGHEAVPPDHGEVRAGGANPDDGQICYGVAKAETFVQALYRAGKNPTRAGLMSALASMNDDEQVRAPWRRTEDVEDGPLRSSARCSSSGSTGHCIWVPVGRLIEGRPRSR